MKKDAPDCELFSLLRKAELFSSLLDDDLGYVATRVAGFNLEKGKELFRSGDEARRFYILKSGEIAIYRRKDPGAEIEIARYVAGDVIGDFDFVLGSRLCDRAIAEVDSELLAFPTGVSGMADIENENPGAAARILLRAAAMISSRLRATQALISTNAPWVRELRRRIYTDPATGLLSRAFLDEEVPKSLEKPTAMILVKPDRFKDLNDAYGHAAGDAAMSELSAALISETERLGRGWALRLRSNETALVVPRCAASEAVDLARRLATLVSRLDIGKAFPGCDFKFTASAALAVWPDDGDDWPRLVESAYAALTKAWSSGGARIYRLRGKRGEDAS
jgi:diguanylate cyclase (GGDEF)-like protein